MRTSSSSSSTTSSSDSSSSSSSNESNEGKNKERKLKEKYTKKVIIKKRRLENRPEKGGGIQPKHGPSSEDNGKVDTMQVQNCELKESCGDITTHCVTQTNKANEVASNKDSLSLPCWFCDEVYFCKNVLKQHIDTHHYSSLFQCKICTTFSTVEISELINHLKIQHKKHETRTSLLQFILLPENLHKITCRNCDEGDLGRSGLWLSRSYDNAKSDIIKHNINVHKQSYAIYESLHVSLGCRVCDYKETLSNKQRWIEHIKNLNHGREFTKLLCIENRIKIKGNINIKPVVRPLLKKANESIQNFEKHGLSADLVQKTKPKINKITKILANEPVIKYVRCPYCNSRKKDNDIAEHRKRKHEKNEFKCQLCTATFDSVADIRRHISGVHFVSSSFWQDNVTFPLELGFVQCKVRGCGADGRFLTLSKIVWDRHVTDTHPGRNYKDIFCRLCHVESEALEAFLDEVELDTHIGVEHPYVNET